jgi:A1 cistron-splicing factor AAR2
MIPITSYLESSRTITIPSRILRQNWFDELLSGSNMSPTTINNSILLLNLPPKALAGIDLLSFTASPRFHGIKNVPPGLHFVFAASDTTLSVRNGAWLYVSPGQGSPQVFVKKWDESTEDLIAETSQAEILRCKANIGSIWKDGLTPYRQSVQEGDSGAEDDWSEESVA